MALYVEIPKDFDEIKRKLVLGLTKRQIICFGTAAAMAVATFWVVHSKLDTTASAYCAFFAAVPAAVFGLPPRNGMYLEERLKLMYAFRKQDSKLKTYQTEDIYDRIEKAVEYKKLKKLLRDYERSQKNGKKT